MYRIPAVSRLCKIIRKEHRGDELPDQSGHVPFKTMRKGIEKATHAQSHVLLTYKKCMKNAVSGRPELLTSARCSLTQFLARRRQLVVAGHRHWRPASGPRNLEQSSAFACCEGLKVRRYGYSGVPLANLRAMATSCELRGRKASCTCRMIEHMRMTRDKRISTSLPERRCEVRGYGCNCNDGTAC